MKMEPGIKTIYDIAFSKDGEMPDFEKMLFAAIARCLWLGSMDTTNSGVVRVQEPSGNFKDIVRDDYKCAFINAVRMLQSVLRYKMKGVVIEDYQNDYQKAIIAFDTMMDWIHKYGIFGSQSLGIIWDWRYKDDNNKPEGKS